MAKDVAHALQTLMHGWLFAALVVAMPQAAAAQAIAPDEARKRLEADRGRLEATQRRSKELQADLDKIAAERQRINERLVETAKLIQQSEGPAQPHRVRGWVSSRRRRSSCAARWSSGTARSRRCSPPCSAWAAIRRR